jgi:hypothetical protein
MYMKPWQLSKENNLQKSMHGVPVGDGTAYDAVVMLDELAKSERRIFVNKAEFRAAILDALQRGDVVIKANDIALADGGRVRRAVVERLYPDAVLDFDADGNAEPRRNSDESPMMKSKSTDVVRDAYRHYTKSPGADLRAAAAELDALVERTKHGE